MDPYGELVLAEAGVDADGGALDVAMLQARASVDYRGKEKGYRIGYAKSEDALNWVRCDENAGIGISAKGWDSEMVSYPHVFELNGCIYLLYLGNQVGREGFGLAVLEGLL